MPWVMDPNEVRPHMKVICCWRFYKSRKEALQYDPVFDHSRAVESESGGKALTILLVIEFILFYFTLISPFIFEWESVLMIYMVYFIQVLLFELAVSCTYRVRNTNLGQINYFLIAKCVIGMLRKAMFMLSTKILSFVVEELFKPESELGWAEVIVGLVSILGNVSL